MTMGAICNDNGCRRRRQQLDVQIARTPMPEEMATRDVTVLCNDCHATGAVRFHVFGLKCPNPQVPP